MAEKRMYFCDFKGCAAKCTEYESAVQLLDITHDRSPDGSGSSSDDSERFHICAAHLRDVYHLLRGSVVPENRYDAGARLVKYLKTMTEKK